jgi:dynein intermediate chain
MGKLEICPIESATVELPPQEREAYARFAQTDLSMEDGDLFVGDAPQSELEPEPEPEETADAEPEEEQVEAEPEVVPLMTDDDFHELSAKPDFDSFFKSTSKLMEKAISQANNFNIFASVTDEVEDTTQEVGVSVYKKFFDPDYCQERTVTDLQWSPRPNEPLLLATYSDRRDATVGSQDADGLALVWSFMLDSRPEHVFECQSPVMTGIFDEFTPHLVIGGTVTGQIVVWDMRVGETNRYPVIKTPLNAQTHTDPVYALMQQGSKNKAQFLMSASTDGRICHWDLANMRAPTSYYKVQQEPVARAASEVKTTRAREDPPQDVSVMGIGAPRYSPSSFLAASDDTKLYSFSYAERDISVIKKEARVAAKDVEEVPDYTCKPQTTLGGHAGPVTGLAVHPGVHDGTEDDDNWKPIAEQYGDLVLSSSTDWTVRLWNHKKKGDAASRLGLKCFEDPKDYVYDVAWSTENPALFAAVDGEGFLSMYDLTSPDLDLPVLKYQVPSYKGRAALNRVRWCPKHTVPGSEHQFEGPTYMKGETHLQGHKVATVRIQQAAVCTQYLLAKSRSLRSYLRLPVRCFGCQGNSEGEVTVCEVPQRTASVNLHDKEMWQRLYSNLAEMDAARE